MYRERTCKNAKIRQLLRSTGINQFVVVDHWAVMETEIASVLRMAAEDEAFRASEVAQNSVRPSLPAYHALRKEMYCALRDCAFLRPFCVKGGNRFLLDQSLKKISEDSEDNMVSLLPGSETVHVTRHNCKDDDVHITLDKRGDRFTTTEYIEATYAKPFVCKGNAEVMSKIAVLGGDIVQYEGCAFECMDKVIEVECLSEQSNAIVVLVPVAKTKRKIDPIPKLIKADLIAHQKNRVVAALKGRMTVIGVPIKDEAGSVSTRGLESLFEKVVLPAIQKVWEQMVSLIAKPVISVVLGRGQALPLTVVLLILETLSKLMIMDRPPTLHLKMLVDTHDHYSGEYQKYPHFCPLAVLRRGEVTPPSPHDTFLQKLLKKMLLQEPIRRDMLKNSEKASAAMASLTPEVVKLPQPLEFSPFRLPLANDMGDRSCIHHYVNLGYALCSDQAKRDLELTASGHQGSVWKMHDEAVDTSVVPTAAARRGSSKQSRKPKRPRLDPEELKRTLLNCSYLTQERKEAIAKEEVGIASQVTSPPSEKLPLNERLQRMAMHVTQLPSVSTIDTPICILLVPPSRSTGETQPGVAVVIAIYMLLVRYRRGLSKCGSIPRLYVIGALSPIVQMGPAYLRQERYISLGRGDDGI